jgi:hypothetical protein
MAEEIVNKVTNSQLKTIDLEDFYPKESRTIIDIKNWLFHELILKEADFREHLKNHNWSKYQNQYVALTCSSDAIIPSWAYMLITTYLSTFAKKVIFGSLKDLETAIFQEIINNFKVEEFLDKQVIIKGCSNKPIPETAYIQIIEKLQPIVKSLMFGEACSTVPLYKRK